MPIPVDNRKKPYNVKVRVSDGSGVDILWSDGHPSHYDFAYLRDLCPCAMCDEVRSKEHQAAARGLSDSASPTPAAANPFPMFKPKLTARAAKAMGQYALQFDFSDGHVTGIYSFDYLRTICPCAECERTFRTFGEPPAGEPTGGEPDKGPHDAGAASRS